MKSLSVSSARGNVTKLPENYSHLMSRLAVCAEPQTKIATKMCYWFFFRFADVLGLDLDEVKTFLDEIPKVPKSAYNDLKDAELSDLESSASDSGSEPVMSRFQVRYLFVSGFTWRSGSDIIFTFCGISLNTAKKILERLHHRLSKFDRSVFLNLKPIFYFFGIYMAWFFYLETIGVH